MQELEAKMKIFGQRKVVVEAENFPAQTIDQKMNFNNSCNPYSTSGFLGNGESKNFGTRFGKSGSTAREYTRFGQNIPNSGSTGFMRNYDHSTELEKFGSNWPTPDDDEASELTKFGQNFDASGSLEFYDEGIEGKCYDNLTLKFELDAVKEEETEV